MIAEKDMQACREAIRHGSLSFYAASKLLPAKVRDPALALYAFCRLADDKVDLTQEKTAAVLDLRDRLELAYAGRPRDAAADRAFAAVIEEFDMPRALPEALLEGLSWDAMDRRYQSLSELTEYSARVASAVGAMMCVLMRMRNADGLARACDLGVAMQLTNIARDVGEDAREGRLYLPLDWFAEQGLNPEAFLANPQATPEILGMVRRLLRYADRLYMRADSGVKSLPVSARPGIFAARYIYAGIGGKLRRMGHDSISARARTNKVQKIGWLGLSMLRAGSTVILPNAPTLFAPPLPEVAFLVDAAAHQRRQEDWSDRMLQTFAQLAAQDRARNAHLNGRGRRAS